MRYPSILHHGAVSGVTGSCHQLQMDAEHALLVDCGLFQGLKELRVKNWETIPPEFKELDLVILTHAHLDHTGYLPILIKNGYSGKIYCTKPTKDLTEIILLDSAKIQEEDARRANEHHYTKHNPAKPLYEVEDAKLTMTHFKTFDLDNVIEIQILSDFETGLNEAKQNNTNKLLSLINAISSGLKNTG